jgi:DNA invertase Pin-like site-specific DNA recombinase
LERKFFAKNLRAEAVWNENFLQKFSSKKVRASEYKDTKIKLSENFAVFSLAICKNRHCLCGVARASRAVRKRFSSRAILKEILSLCPKAKKSFCFFIFHGIFVVQPIQKSKRSFFKWPSRTILESFSFGLVALGWLFKFSNFFNNNYMQKFFLYARKSTDVEDKQALSIEAQITELRTFAKVENLEIVEELIEKQSAKIPGRPIFNTMLERIEKGEVSGILSWHPDRLARNSIDGGRIIFLIDTGKIKALKSPTFWFEPTPQGKFMLNIAFGQSKYFVDNLSENTKRGLRQKLRRGELPGYAPLGYLNDLLKHTMYKDPERFRLVRKIFELYATGNYSLKDLRKLITSAGLLSRKKNMLSVSNIQSILSNILPICDCKYAINIYQRQFPKTIYRILHNAYNPSSDLIS